MSERDEIEAVVLPTFGRKWNALKLVAASILFAVAVFVTITQTGILALKEGAVSSERVAQIESQLKEVKADYVRKEAIQPQLDIISRRVENIERLLMEEKRRERR